MTTMHNTFRVGTLDRRQVWITAEMTDDRLSFTGEVVTRQGCEPDQCGQILDALRDPTLKPYGDWTRERLAELAATWERWHLNDVRAGCEHQRAEGWSDRPIDPDKPMNTYGLHYPGQTQASWNMLAWVRPDEHPDGLLTKPCDVCGYRYGTAWLSEDIPADVRAYVASLA